MEDYRKNLVKTLQETPKEQRGNVLQEAQNTNEYSDSKNYQIKIRDLLKVKNYDLLLRQIISKNRELYDNLKFSEENLKNEFGEKISILNPEVKNRPFSNMLSHTTVKESLVDAFDAIIDSREELQPLGLDVVELANEHKIPVVMATAHHAKGQLSVGLINDFLKRENIFNGEVISDREIQNNEGGKNYDADCFLVIKDPIFFSEKIQTEKDYLNKWFKGSYEEFIKYFKDEARENDGMVGDNQGVKNLRIVFESLKNKILQKNLEKNHLKILFVEDNKRNFDALTIALVKQIENGEVEVSNAKDFQIAKEMIENGKWDGIISDCYFPDNTGTQDKSHGEAVLKKIASQYLDEDSINEILTTGKAKRKEIEESILNYFKK